MLEFEPSKTPNLQEIESAFRAVFPIERLRDVQYSIDGDRVVFTVHSDVLPTRAIKTRTYAKYENETYEEVFRKTASLDSGLPPE